MSGVSPLSFPVASMGSAGGYWDRESWSMTPIPAPSVPLSRAVVRRRGTAALRGAASQAWPHHTAAGTQASQPGSASTSYGAPTKPSPGVSESG